LSAHTAPGASLAVDGRLLAFHRKRGAAQIFDAYGAPRAFIFIDRLTFVFMTDERRAFTLEDDCLNTGKRHRAFDCVLRRGEIERVHPLYVVYAKSREYRAYIRLASDAAHCRSARTRMRLASSHGRRGIIQHGHYDIGPVVNSVHHARYAGMKKRRISYEGKIDHVGLDSVKSLRHRYAGAHTETGVNHIERHGVAKRVTAYVARENGLASP
jgi:hypothetical protein